MIRLEKPSSLAVPSRFLYVAGIGHQMNTKKSDVMALFGCYGAVEEVIFQQNKRFLYVVFDCPSSATHAKEGIEAIADIAEHTGGCIGKLHIEYAVETVEKIDAVVSEPECTSTTDGVSVPGLELVLDFLSAEDERALLDSDEFVSKTSPKWVAELSRRVQHFGYAFNYKTLLLDLTHPAPPFPEEYQNLARQVAAFASASSESSREPISRLSGQGMDVTSPSTLTQLTINEYEAGQGIAAHVDTESALGPVIFVLSLGSGVTTTLTRVKGDVSPPLKKHVFVPRRSLLVLRGDARYLWTHMIAHRRTDMVRGVLVQRQRRVSLTFRQALLPDVGAVNLKCSSIEQDHVYRVYDSIALHWHHTRGKRRVHWHTVKDFVEALPAGSLMADVGSGDGKYFGLNPDVLSIGCDRSVNLLHVSRDGAYETFCCDAVQLPLVTGVFDAAICIAVLHHIASVDRRISLIKELLRICRTGGSVLVQAWALEQESSSKRNFAEQDVLVPWRLQKHFQGDDEATSETGMPEGPCVHVVEDRGELVYQRYCHVYREGELEELCASIPNCRVVEAGFDKGNWFVHIVKAEQGDSEIRSAA